MKSNLTFGLFLICSYFSFAQQVDYDNSVRFSASDVGDGLLIEWVDEPNVTNYLISRRNPGATTYSLLANVAGTETSYKDSTIVEGKLYEYKIAKLSPTSNITGYMAGGIKVLNETQKGNLLLLIKENLKEPLEFEFKRLESDLITEGWYVVTHYVNDTLDVADVKKLIKEYATTPDAFRTVYLLGNIPVPYSGLIAPDGHPDHIGAWPCDAFYSDIDGFWSDAIANNTAATGTRNDNVHGDGKFDQNALAKIELEIGRVDLSNLSAFPQNEIELTRNYLNKNHAYRNGEIQMPNRGLIQNNFPTFGEAFGQSGVNNFSRMFGKENVFYLPYKSTLQQEKYLWSYGCGPGNYTGAGGIGNTFELVNENHQTIFTMLFGSYFGDWDNENNYLRAALASGSTLTNVWAGRPHWYFQHMAMGESIGYSTKLTQNNSEFPTGAGGKSVHIALMGDPTLDMHPGFDAIENVNYEIDGNKAIITWETLNDEEYAGYLVYLNWDPENNGPYFLVNGDNVYSKEKKYTYSCLDSFKYKFLVKAIKLQHTGSGSFYNQSNGVEVEFNVNERVKPNVNLIADVYYDQINLQSNITGGNFSSWYIGNEVFQNEADSNLTYFTYNPGEYWICLVGYNGCYYNSECETIITTSSLPEIQIIKTEPLCHDDTVSVELKVIKENAPFEVVWSDGTKGLKNNNITKLYTGYTITTSTGRIQSSSITTDFPDSINISVTITPEIENISKGSINLIVTGGTLPYSLNWSSGIFPNLDSLSAGQYSLTVTDANGCIEILSFTIELITGTIENDFSNEFVIKNSNDELILEAKSESFKIDAVSLFNNAGSKVLNFNPNDNKSQWMINHVDFTSGLYSIQIERNGKLHYLKWIKL